MSDIKHNPHGDRPPVPVGPEMLPPPDPRLTGRQPVTEAPPAQERHPAGRPEGGQFR